MTRSTQDWKGLLLLFAVPVLVLVAGGLVIMYQTVSIERGIVAEQRETLERRPALVGIFEWSEQGDPNFRLTVHPGLGDSRRVRVPPAPADGVVTITGLPGAGLPEAIVTFSGESGTARARADEHGAYTIEMRVHKDEQLYYSYRFLRAHAPGSDAQSISPNRLTPDAT